MSDEKQNPWKAAIIDELIVDCIYSKEHESDPRKALAEAIAWNVKVALDPSASKEARDMQQAAIDAALESVATDLLGIAASMQEINPESTVSYRPEVAAYRKAASLLRSRIGTNPLAERDARIAELERELSEQADTIVDGLAKRRELEREEYGDAPQVTDKGPWTPSDDGRHIQSEDFEHDVTLRVSGDFATDEDRIAYTKWLAAKLNATPQVPDGMVLVSPEGEVIGPCVCGGWPGGKCLRCKVVSNDRGERP